MARIIRTVPLVAAVVALAAAIPQAQTTGAEAELKKVGTDFSQAWVKGDAKAIAAMHTEDAIRLPGTGQVINGRAEIEQNYAQALSGPFKGSQIVITPGQVKQLTADVYVGEGRFEISGGTMPPGTPTSGTYANTYVRRGGRWLLAMSAVSYPPAPR
jgi:uncharacterized protein (TIGR02246 family)